MKAPSRHNSRNIRITKISVILLGVLVMGMILPAILSEVSRIVISPVHRISVWFDNSSDTLPLYLKDRQELIDRIQHLENDLSLVANTDLTQQRLYEENVWLRGLLGSDVNSRIAAAVIARPNELPYDLLQIDQGENDGVEVGAPVYIGADNVVGIIQHTAPTYAFVRLFTTPGFSASVFLSGPNVMATLEGYGGGVARVRVPQGIPIGVGNLVHLPSIEPGVFGRIAYVENRPSQPEQYGYITFMDSIQSIRYVAVGRGMVPAIDPPVVEASVLELIKQSTVVPLDLMQQLSLSTATSTDVIATSTAQNESSF